MRIDSMLDYAAFTFLEMKHRYEQLGEELTDEQLRDHWENDLRPPGRAPRKARPVNPSAVAPPRIPASADSPPRARGSSAGSRSGSQSCSASYRERVKAATMAPPQVPSKPSSGSFADYHRGQVHAITSSRAERDAKPAVPQCPPPRQSGRSCSIDSARDSDAPAAKAAGTVLIEEDVLMERNSRAR